VHSLARTGSRSTAPAPRERRLADARIVLDEHVPSASSATSRCSSVSASWTASRRSRRSAADRGVCSNSCGATGRAPRFHAPPLASAQAGGRPRRELVGDLLLLVRAPTAPRRRSRSRPRSRPCRSRCRSAKCRSRLRRPTLRMKLTTAYATAPSPCSARTRPTPGRSPRLRQRRQHVLGSLELDRRRRAGVLLELPRTAPRPEVATAAHQQHVGALELSAHAPASSAGLDRYHAHAAGTARQVGGEERDVGASRSGPRASATPIRPELRLPM